MDTVALSAAHPSVGLVVLTWNGWDDTKRCLDSLAQVSYPRCTVIVVDNGSGDGTEQHLRMHYSHLSVLQNGDNLGYAAGNNRGIAQLLNAGLDYVGVLNNDTVVETHFLEPLVSALALDGTLDAVSPQIDYIYKSSTTASWFSGAAIDKSSGLPVHCWDGPSDGSVQRTDLLTGCCFLAKREVFEHIGGFDERYFLMFEDSDWSMRAVHQEHSFAVVPRSRIQHAVSSSFARAQSSVGAYYYVRNGLLFISTYSATPFRHSIQFVWRDVVRISGSDLVRGRALRQACGRFAGLAAFVLRRWGRAPRLVERLLRNRATKERFRS